MLTNADMLNMALDALMIAAIGGLWLMWARASRRQRQVESLLLGASEQLDATLAHLERAMEHIRRIEAANLGQGDGKASPEAENKPAGRGSRVTPIRSQAREPAMPPSMPEMDADDAGMTPVTTASAAPLTRVLRLHREGFAAEEIARREDIALAKVRLMLKLHANQAAA